VELDEKKAEPYRLLMAKMIRGEALDSTLVENGLPYWEQAAARFAHTPYGEAIEKDIRKIGALA
jgi:hypothetical protein